MLPHLSPRHSSFQYSEVFEQESAGLRPLATSRRAGVPAARLRPVGRGRGAGRVEGPFRGKTAPGPFPIQKPITGEVLPADGAFVTTVLAQADW